MSLPRAVLLDALGTLVRLEPPGPRLRASLRHRFDLDVGADLAHAAMVAEMRHYAAYCHRAHDDATLAALRLECAGVLADALGVGLSGPELLPSLTDAIAFAVYDDVPAALDGLAAEGVRLAVVSNWDVSLLDTLRVLRLAARFETVVHSAGAGASKPDPRPFTLALERLALTPDAAAHVGDDRHNDLVGARAAGLRGVLLDRSGRAPDAIASLAELPAALRAGPA